MTNAAAIAKRKLEQKPKSDKNDKKPENYKKPDSPEKRPAKPQIKVCKLTFLGNSTSCVFFFLSQLCNAVSQFSQRPRLDNFN